MKEVEIFILTNGASSYPYALDSVKKQTIECKHTTIKDKPIDIAMLDCLYRCNSPYLIVLNDDMFLHPRAIEFYRAMAQELNSRVGIFACMLWERWPRNMMIQCVKMYNARLAKKIGFKKDERGKVDREFSKSLREQGYELMVDKSIVALHLLRSKLDQEVYRDLWIKNSEVESVEEYSTIDKDQSTIYPEVPYVIQIKELLKLEKFNKEKNSIFWRVLSNGN